MTEKTVRNDFSRGSIPAVVMRMALPLIAAQLVNVLYNVVDRIYIGHIPGICRSYPSFRRSPGFSDRAERRSALWHAAAATATRRPA